MNQDYIHELRNVIRELHGTESTHVESVAVKETFKGKTVWDGVVEVFELHGHPKAKLAYAWLRGVAHSPLENPESEYTIVLGIPPVISPETAVKAAIVAEVKELKNKGKSDS